MPFVHFRADLANIEYSFKLGKHSVVYQEVFTEPPFL